MAIAVLVLSVGTFASAETVTVCMGTPAPGVPAAQRLASGIFKDIDIQIRWMKNRNCPPEAIRVTLQMFSDDSERPGTLGYALPFQGTRVVVFYDRISRFPQRVQTSLLAHVLAHEIAHMLQGIVSHSMQGIMKAEWTPVDHDSMGRGNPLAFSAHDAELIHLGMAARRLRSSRTES